MRFRLIMFATLSVVAARVCAQSPVPAIAAINKQPVPFRSGTLNLVGFLFKPEGAGPFPAVLWNHGSERGPGQGPQFDSAAAVFVRAGYVLFAPVRRGHIGSDGAYIVEETDRARAAGGWEAANRLTVNRLETVQLDDQLAGLAALRTYAFVDTTRIVVAGCSYGGIQTLLGAERGAGYRAAVAISPAALSWEMNPLLRERLLRAVGGTKIPVMILQPAKDASLGPSRVLGAEFTRLGKAFTGKIFPSEGPDELQGHCFGGAKGMHVWAEDALAFIKEAIR